MQSVAIQLAGCSAELEDLQGAATSSAGMPMFRSKRRRRPKFQKDLRKALVLGIDRRDSGRQKVGELAAVAVRALWEEPASRPRRNPRAHVQHLQAVIIETMQNASSARRVARGRNEQRRNWGSYITPRGVRTGAERIRPGAAMSPARTSMQTDSTIASMVQTRSRNKRTQDRTTRKMDDRPSVLSRCSSTVSMLYMVVGLQYIVVSKL
eukprot:3118393-Pyramimonas_sp.AAC.1